MTAAAETTAGAAPVAATPVRAPGERRRKAVRGGLYASAVLLSLWVLAPIYLITVSAFVPRQAIYDYPKSIVPAEWSTETMAFFAGSSGVLDSLGNSVLVAIITLTLSTLLGAPAGYAMARYIFKGRAAYRLAILSTRMFPIVILSIPLAITFIQWGIYDTIWAVALMHTALALPFTVLITSSVFASVPREYEEAAQIYGCNPLRGFLKVVMPLAMPGIAAAAIFTWVLSWNEVFAAVILTLSERTLPALVLSVLTQSPLPFRFAAAWFMLAPALLVIFLIRRYLLGMWGVQ